MWSFGTANAGWADKGCIDLDLGKVSCDVRSVELKQLSIQAMIVLCLCSVCICGF